MKTLSIMLLICWVTGVTLLAEAQVIPFDSDRWDKSKARMSEIKGRKCIQGIAMLKDVEFTNGVIEFDLTVTGERSYPGIVFRAQGEDTYERVYIRPHLSDAFQNVVQYAGTFNGIDSWQLYYGEGKTASASIPANQWFHMRIEVHGTQARVFVNNSDTPVLYISELAHGLSQGTIGVWGPADGSAWFSDFSYRVNDSLIFPSPAVSSNQVGMITSWEVSNPLKLSTTDIEKVPDEQSKKSLTWQRIESLPTGLVDISRYYARKNRTPEVVWARTEIVSENGTSRQYAFGYSDVISIFLNGKIVFIGNSAYTSRDKNFQGIVGLNDYIFLPLREGKNELMIAVAESFGGWGFMFRDVNAVYQHTDLVKLWEKRFSFSFPESVVYDRKRDVLYVSNFTYENDGFISKVKMNGEIEDPAWVKGIVQPTGMCIYNDKLYVVGRYNLIEIDLEKAVVSNRYPFPSPVFANDIACDPVGTMYITDGGKACIYKFEKNVITEWAAGKELKQANGIAVSGNKVIAGVSGAGKIVSIDMDTKKMNTVINFGANTVMDGLLADMKGALYISDYAGRLFKVYDANHFELLLDTRPGQVYIADFEFIPEKKLFVIPTLDDNRLVMYKLNR